jgi:dienelactone hydrolase
MEKINKEEHIIKGFEEREFLLDLQYQSLKMGQQPIAIFVHGFKGFKDWGAFNYISKQMAAQGLAWCKFNFSRNGTTVDEPTTFNDPEAFGNNNYSIEISEIGLVIDWIEQNAERCNLNKNEIYLVGHSRGATMAIIKSVEDTRVKKTVAWAPFFDMKSRFRPETIVKWEKDGVWLVENIRTGQKLPLYPQFYKDYAINQHRFDMAEVSANYEKPLLILHAKDDPAVNVEEARMFYNHIAHSIKIELDSGGHTFGVAHPFDETKPIPQELTQIIENTFEFLID